MTHRLGAEAWPRWIELVPAKGETPAAEVLFGRPTRSMKRRAQREARALLGEAGDDEARDELDLADAGDAYSAALIRQGIRDWRGFGDAAGEPIAVSPEAVELFLADDDLFAAADLAYVIPVVMRDAEKNGFSASPGGTGEAETRGSDTATSAAPAAPGAKSALTGSTNRKARRAKTSGT